MREPDTHAALDELFPSAKAPSMPEWKRREIENLNRVLKEHAKQPPEPITEPWDC